MKAELLSSGDSLTRFPQKKSRKLNPEEEEAASVVADKIEPELEETLFIQEGITLQQMTGVDPATRPAVDSIDE